MQPERRMVCGGATLADVFALRAAQLQRIEPNGRKPGG
jgi:hypothetical protein